MESPKHGSGRTYVDCLIHSTLRDLKKDYAALGSPRLILERADTFDAFVQTHSRYRHSLEYARLLDFISDLIIARGGTTTEIHRAIDNLDNARRTRSRCQRSHDVTIKETVHNLLLTAVAYKSIGRRDDAIWILKSNIAILRQMGADEIDLEPLNRQIDMMSGEPSRVINRLYATQDWWAKSPLEAYATVKRAVEVRMNRYERIDQIALEQEMQILRLLFGQASTGLPPLSHVSHQKNMGQYELLSARTEPEQDSARVSLSETLNNALGLGLLSQARQCLTLIGLSFGAQKIALPTFVASDFKPLQPDLRSMSALTDRDRRLLRLTDRMDREIAAEVHLSERTVSNSLNRIYQQLGLTTGNKRVRAHSMVLQWDQKQNPGFDS